MPGLLSSMNAVTKVPLIRSSYYYGTVDELSSRSVPTSSKTRLERALVKGKRSGGKTRRRRAERSVGTKRRRGRPHDHQNPQLFQTVYFFQSIHSIRPSNLFIKKSMRSSTAKLIANSLFSLGGTTGIQRLRQPWTRPCTKYAFSSSVVQPRASQEHCENCTCDQVQGGKIENSVVPTYPCGSPKHEDEFGHLPPPLPEPTYSVNKRILPSSLTALSSEQGRDFLLQALTNKTAQSYWSLMEQFMNQSDPAFCGITTLVMVLNAMSVDPNIRWRGGWRFFGSEDVILNNCCLSAERIRRAGVTLEEFRLLAKCQGLGVEMKRPIDPQHKHDDCMSVPANVVHHPHRPSECQSLDTFRDDIRRILTTAGSDSLMVVSFSRACKFCDSGFPSSSNFHLTEQATLPQLWGKLVMDTFRLWQPIMRIQIRS